MASSSTATASQMTGRMRDAREAARPGRRQAMQAGPEINVGLAERIGSGAIGAALALLGLGMLVRRGSVLGGLGLAATGATLAYRGASGYCPAYKAMGVEEEDASATSHPLNRFIQTSHRVTINRSPEELYTYWRNFENLPQIMRHLHRVEVQDEGWSHWVAAAPHGKTVAWDAKITEDRPDELIAWRAAEDASVPNHGHVRFQPLPHGHGTAVEVNLSYRPPAGVVGALFARIMGEAPQQQLHEDLRRFKQTMEAGETATTVGQPRGVCQ
ncbi:MAG: SRPBCC family protein [Phycisphaeraceae bacterium]